MDPNEKVFENTFLLEQVLSHALPDIAADLKLRLVSKKFNNAFLAVLRKEYRSIVMKFAYDNFVTAANIEFYFNGRELGNSKVSQFFRFLNKVANVRVENLAIRNMSVFSLAKVKAIHDAIHSELIGEHRQHIRKFIGVETICKECEDCLDIAKTAEEYGPIKLSTLRRLERVEHSRRLIITSDLLNQIANDCILNNVSKEECFEQLDNIIKPDLSCDTMILWISESQTKRFPENPVPRDHFHIPLEVLEMFIRKWSIKHLQIHFIFDLLRIYHKDRWMGEDYFTPFRFNDQEDFIMKESLIKLNSIEVDLVDSFYCRRDFAFFPRQINRGYSNLLVNIQKVFSTNLISIKSFFRYSTKLSEIYSTFCNILKILSKSGRIQTHCQEQLPTLIVNFECFIFISDFSKFCSNNEQENVTYFDVLEEFSNSKSPSFIVYHRPSSNPIYSPKDGENLKFIGKKYVIEHNGTVFNLGIFLNETAINQETTNRNIKKFLNFFV